MRTAADVILAFVAIYPIVTAAIWIAGGFVFSVTRERNAPPLPSTEDLPRVSVLIPAYNEEADIAAAVRAALAVDYPDFEVLVLDDGSTDATAERARRAAGSDSRLTVIGEAQNRGKAATLNLGALAATGVYLVFQDADATIHPLALRALVATLEANPRAAAVAGDPRVTNRGSLLAELQTLEFAAIIGLIRRTEAVGARVGVVAGVIGIFRREAFRAVGGFDRRMATEDIELTYRLLLAGWYTTYEPRALVGMRVPTNLRALWRQRRRWARGQGEVLHVHGPTLARWRNRHLWSIFAEPLISLVWIILFALIFVTTAIRMSLGDVPPILTYLPEWGVAVGAITTIQFLSALLIEWRYDREAPAALLLGPLYPACYWLLNALAALTSELPAVCAGPRDVPVHWDTRRVSSEDGDGGDVGTRARSGQAAAHRPVERV
jgi:biofilm PGA synthesis N-glycosyltransferase PgaC